MGLNNGQAERLKQMICGFELVDMICGKKLGQTNLIGNLRQELTEFNDSAKPTLDALFMNRNRGKNKAPQITRGYEDLFASVDEDGAYNIINSVLTNTEPGGLPDLSDVSIRILYGATEEAPFRALAYPVAVLRLWEELFVLLGNDRARMPRIDIILSDDSGASINQLDRPRVNHASSVIYNSVSQYIQTAHPNVAEFVNFYRDEGFTTYRQNLPGHNDLMHKITETMSSDAGMMAMFEQFANGRKGNMYDYAAVQIFESHGFVNNDQGYNHVLTGSQMPDCNMIMSVGCKTEAPFFQAGKMTAQLVAQFYEWFTQRMAAQFILKEKVPPYNIRSEHDLRLLDVVQNPNLLDEVREGMDGLKPKNYGYEERSYDTLVSDLGDETGEGLKAFMSSLHKNPEFYDNIESVANYER